MSEIENRIMMTQTARQFLRQVASSWDSEDCIVDTITQGLSDHDYEIVEGFADQWDESAAEAASEIVAVLSTPTEHRLPLNEY